MKGSWKTTTTGIATVIVAVGSAVLAILDGDPKTVPNWETTIAAVTAGFGLVFARDNKVTSEDVGLK